MFFHHISITHTFTPTPTYTQHSQTPKIMPPAGGGGGGGEAKAALQEATTLLLEFLEVAIHQLL
jgi:hypothetical protein